MSDSCSDLVREWVQVVPALEWRGRWRSRYRVFTNRFLSLEHGHTPHAGRFGAAGRVCPGCAGLGLPEVRSRTSVPPLDLSGSGGSSVSRNNWLISGLPLPTKPRSC